MKTNRNSIILTVIAVVAGLLIVSALLAFARHLLGFIPVVLVIAVAYALLSRRSVSRGVSVSSSLATGLIIGLAVVAFWMLFAWIVVLLIVLGLILVAAFM